MFKENIFITQGIKAQIPGYLQYLMIYMIQNMEVVKKDYFQVFEISKVLENGQPMQKIIHIQEEPEYSSIHVFKAKNIITGKVFVIDETTHCTMLLPEEY